MGLIPFLSPISIVYQKMNRLLLQTIAIRTYSLSPSMANNNKFSQFWNPFQKEKRDKPKITKEDQKRNKIYILVNVVATCVLGTVTYFLFNMFTGNDLSHSSKIYRQDARSHAFVKDMKKKED